jgi:hypothetical protein
MVTMGHPEALIILLIMWFITMIRENRQLVTYEPVEFEK